MYGCGKKTPERDVSVDVEVHKTSFGAGEHSSRSPHSSRTGMMNKKAIIEQADVPVPGAPAILAERHHLSKEQ